MRRSLFLSAALFVLPLFACANDGTVGESCEDDEVCEASLTCIRHFPGTFCAQSCPEEGDTASCPQDMVCAQQLTNGLMCSHTCEDDDDCREGYLCTAAAGGQSKVCRVKTQ